MYIFEDFDSIPWMNYDYINPFDHELFKKKNHGFAKQFLELNYDFMKLYKISPRRSPREEGYNTSPSEDIMFKYNAVKYKLKSIKNILSHRNAIKV